MQLTDTTLLRGHSLVGDTWLPGEGGTLENLNPADGSLVGTVSKLTAEQSAAAIGHASAAFRAWSRRPGAERGELLRAWGELMLEHEDDLAALMTAEQGKPLDEARGEVRYAASFLTWFAQEAPRVRGDVLATPERGMRVMTLRQPVGVVAAITPWNFPLAMLTRKAGAALAAGCTMLAKPAEATPLSALALAELALRAGFPPGVFNVIIGDAATVTGPWLDSPIVRKLTFTGSTGVGRLLMERSAATLKRVSLELGGNAPFLVFEDADLDAAADGVIASKFRNTGQTCVCPNRVLVQRSILEAFTDRLRIRMQMLKVGPGADPGVQQGPLIDDAALDKVSRHVSDALRRGATLKLGGEPHPLGGTFWSPTLLTGCTPDMALAQEETFGPVAALFPFDTEEEALGLANDTPYGLAAYFYTTDLARTFRVAEALQAGMVGINTGRISRASSPFGGVKASGMGREGSHLGVDEYLDVKTLTLGGID